MGALELSGAHQRALGGLLATWGAFGGLGWLLEIFGVAFCGPWKPLGRSRVQGRLTEPPRRPCRFSLVQVQHKAFPEEVKDEISFGNPGVSWRDFGALWGGPFGLLGQPWGGA